MNHGTFSSHRLIIVMQFPTYLFLVRAQDACHGMMCSRSVVRLILLSIIYNPSSRLKRLAGLVQKYMMISRYLEMIICS